MATLALGFGGSVGALQRMALNYRISLDDAEARRIVDAWREANPWAREFWGAHRDGESYRPVGRGDERLGGARPDHHGGPDRLRLSRGLSRRLAVHGAALGPAADLPPSALARRRRSRPDGKPTGEKRSELSFRRAHGRAKLWHGTLCENAVQAAAADLLRATVTRIETNPALAFMPIRMTTHDEIVCEVDEAAADEAKAILRREMLTLPDWAAGLPLQSEEASLPVLHQNRKRPSNERTFPSSRSALLPGKSRYLALRARRCLSYRAPRRRQGRCRAHGVRRPDPRRTPPPRAGDCAEAGRHDRMAGRGRVLAASSRIFASPFSTAAPSAGGRSSRPLPSAR